MWVITELNYTQDFAFFVLVSQPFGCFFRRNFRWNRKLTCTKIRRRSCLPMRSDRLPGYGCNVLRNRIFWTCNLLYLISQIHLIFILHLQFLDSSRSRFRNNLGITAPPLSIHQRRRYSCCPIDLSFALAFSSPFSRDFYCQRIFCYETMILI